MKVIGRGAVNYQKKKEKLRLETEKRRKEIKDENFNEFLKEESAKCVLGYNPYQE